MSCESWVLNAVVSEPGWLLLAIPLILIAAFLLLVGGITVYQMRYLRTELEDRRSTFD